MKNITILLSMLIIVGCTQDRNYIPKAPRIPTPASFYPTLLADPSGDTMDASKTFTGQLAPNTNKIEFHATDNCQSLLAEDTSLSPGIDVPLLEGQNLIYIKITKTGGETVCYPEVVRVYNKDTVPPSTAGVSYTLLTPNVSPIRNSAVQASNTNDAVKATYYPVSGCGTPMIGMGNNLSNVGLVFPASQLSNLYVILEDAAGNQTACVDTGIDFEHDPAAPTATLASPANPTTSHIITTNLQGTVDNTSTLPGIPTIVIHKNSPTCSNAITGDVYTLFTTGGVSLTVDNLATTTYHGFLTDTAGNTSCTLLLTYNHILGPLDNTVSSWTIQKTVVSRSTPENNIISFSARDINNNPLSGLTVAVDLIDQSGVPVADVDLALPESGTSGNYSGTTNLQYTYQVDIDPIAITSYTPRTVGIVYASDYPYCFQAGRASATGYDSIGAGTSVAPYEICHAVQLKDLAENCNSGVQDACDDEYILMNEIDLADWYPRGTAINQEFILADNISTPLTGSFNGNDLSILNYQYTQDLNQFIGMFGYAENFSLTNLTHSYSYNSPTATLVGGLFEEVYGDIAMSNLDITGVITTAPAAEVGGVLYGAFLDSGTFTDNKINISITNFRAGGGFAFLIFGSISQVNMSGLDATVNMNQALTAATGTVGGIVGQSDLLDLSDIQMAVDMDFDSTGAPTVGGLVGYLSRGQISTSYATGSINEVGVNGSAELGGFVGIVDDGSIHDSFALVDVMTPDCSAKCGKILGDTFNPPGTFFINLFSSTETTLDLGVGFFNSSVVETDIDTVAQPGYFTDPANSPLDQFDFVNTWMDNSGTPALPTLQ